MKTALAIFLFLLCVQPLYAESDAPPFMEFFESVAGELNVPLSAVLAIGRVESGLTPWTLNIEGRSYRFASKGEALAKAEEANVAGRSFDVGVMQINRWWLDRYEISLEAAFDPLANIYLGCWIFKQEMVRHKNLRAAIGAYHSPDPLRANRYANQVMKALAKGPTGAQSKPETATRPAPKRAAVVVDPSNSHRLQLSEATTFKVGYHSDQSMKVRKK